MRSHLLFFLHLDVVVGWGVFSVCFDHACSTLIEQVIIQFANETILPSDVPWVLNVGVEESLLYVKMRGNLDVTDLSPGICKTNMDNISKFLAISYSNIPFGYRENRHERK